MSVKTLPLDLELVIYAGTTLHREYRWIPETGTALDLTGWTGQMLIGPYGGEAVYELTLGDGLDLTSDGRIIFDLDPTATEDLRGRPDLAYQLDLTDTDGYTLRFLQGRVSVWRHVEPKP